MNEEYLTEEELNKLIHSVEEGRMLKAPSYLKSEILTEIDEEQKQVQNKKKKRQLIFFEMKMIGGMAAAIFMLFLLPVSAQGEPTEVGNPIAAETQDFFHTCTQKLDEMLEGIGWVTDLLMKPMQKPDTDRTSDENDSESKPDTGGMLDENDSESKPDTGETSDGNDSEQKPDTGGMLDENDSESKPDTGGMLDENDSESKSDTGRTSGQKKRME